MTEITNPVEKLSTMWDARKTIEAILLAVILWMGVTVNDTQIAVAKIEERTSLFADPEDRWTEEEHEVYAQRIDKELSDHEKRLRALELSIRK